MNRTTHLPVWLFSYPIATICDLPTNVTCIVLIQNIFLSSIARDNLWQGVCVHAHITEHWVKRRQRKIKKSSVLNNTCNHQGFVIGDLYK